MLARAVVVTGKAALKFSKTWRSRVRAASKAVASYMPLCQALVVPFNLPHGELLMGQCLSLAMWQVRESDYCVTSCAALSLCNKGRHDMALVLTLCLTACSVPSAGPAVQSYQ